MTEQTDSERERAALDTPGDETPTDEPLLDDADDDDADESPAGKGNRHAKD